MVAAVGASRNLAKSSGARGRAELMAERGGGRAGGREVRCQTRGRGEVCGGPSERPFSVFFDKLKINFMSFTIRACTRKTGRLALGSAASRAAHLADSIVWGRSHPIVPDGWSTE